MCVPVLQIMARLFEQKRCSDVTDDLEQVLQDVVDGVGEAVARQVRRRVDLTLVPLPVFT